MGLGKKAHVNDQDFVSVQQVLATGVFSVVFASVCFVT